ncbi:hypothetical protein ACFLS7_06395 [Bacteroidota bacterium]
MNDDKFRDFMLSSAYSVIFQSNTLKYIVDEYGLSKTDFTVLAAGYLLQKTSCTNQFSAGEVRRFVVGIWKDEVYQAVRRLSDRKYIQQGVSKAKRKRYVLTQKGVDCVSSYTEYLSMTIQKFQFDNPGYYMMYP